MADANADPIDAFLRTLFDTKRRDTVLPTLRQRAVIDATIRKGLRTYDKSVADEASAIVAAALGVDATRPYLRATRWKAVGYDIGSGLMRYCSIHRAERSRRSCRMIVR